MASKKPSTILEFDAPLAVAPPAVPEESQNLNSPGWEQSPNSEFPSFSVQDVFEAVGHVRSTLKPRLFNVELDHNRIRYWTLNLLLTLAILFFLAGVGVATYPFVSNAIYQYNQTTAITDAERKVAKWPSEQVKKELVKIQAYNNALYHSGQPIIGGIPSNPYAAAQNPDQADLTAASNETYQSLMNTGQGIMGSVIIPKIGVDLPIYHGTSMAVLSQGAGQVYGTSLPIGGPSTHTVIAAHRGLVHAMMFTRLDEMRIGDFFYFKVLGETLAYRVINISVILPTDVQPLRIVPGKDLATLLTCTPYGINTHRLLVTGIRVSMPQPAPFPYAVPRDQWTALVLGALGVLLTFFIGLPFNVLKNRWVRLQHEDMNDKNKKKVKRN